jgi:hypothetical protein
MGLTDAGRDFIAGALTGTQTTLFNNANARLAVGDSLTAFSKSQTDLQASTNKIRKAMDTGYPITSANVLTFKATYGSAEANWAWSEWGIFNASSGGTMLNRKVESLGTKVPGSTWVLTVTVTITN